MNKNLYPTLILAIITLVFALATVWSNPSVITGKLMWTTIILIVVTVIVFLITLGFANIADNKPYKEPIYGRDR